jgi:short-subunit dehydrogenase involved in D-alanine esterification of teichoic acids
MIVNVVPCICTCLSVIADMCWHVQVTMQTNYHGPMALMQLLLPKLKDSKPSRVVWTSSGLESIGTLPDLSNLDALE